MFSADGIILGLRCLFHTKISLEGGADVGMMLDQVMSFVCLMAFLADLIETYMVIFNSDSTSFFGAEFLRKRDEFQQLKSTHIEKMGSPNPSEGGQRDSDGSNQLNSSEIGLTKNENTKILPNLIYPSWL